MDENMIWKLTVGGTVGGACAVFTACLVFAILVCRRRMKQRKRARELARRLLLQTTPPWSHDPQATPLWVHKPCLGAPPLAGSRQWTDFEPGLPTLAESEQARIGLIDSQRDLMTSPPCVHRDVGWLQGLSGDTTPRPASSLEYSPGCRDSSTTTDPSIPSSDTVDQSSSSNTWWLHQAVTSRRGCDVTAGSTISRTNLEEFFLSLEDDERDFLPPGTAHLNRNPRDHPNNPSNNRSSNFPQPTNYQPNACQLNNRQPYAGLPQSNNLKSKTKSLRGHHSQPNPNIQPAVCSLPPPEPNRSRKSKTVSMPNKPSAHSSHPAGCDWPALASNRVRAPRLEYLSDSVDFGYVSDRSRVHRPSDAELIPGSWIAEQHGERNGTDESQTSLGLVEMEPYGELGKRSRLRYGYKSCGLASKRMPRFEPCDELEKLSSANGFKSGVVAERKPHWEEEPDEIWLPRISHAVSNRNVGGVQANKKPDQKR